MVDGVVGHTFSSSTLALEAGRSLNSGTVRTVTWKKKNFWKVCISPDINQPSPIFIPVANT